MGADPFSQHTVFRSTHVLQRHFQESCPVLRRIKKSVIRSANAIASGLEGRLVDGSDTPLAHPPIFVLGAPRSGSTLFYECLTRRFDLAYFSNIHHTFFACPSIIERLFHVCRWERTVDYKSNCGYIKGGSSPSEAWNFWYRFFRRTPQFVSLEDVAPKKMRCMRGAIRAFESACGQSIVIKNLPCVLRLEPLAKYLPEALFLVLRRDTFANARSILVARKEYHHDYKRWWSVEVPGFEQLVSAQPEEQVVQQIREIDRLIDTGRELIGKDHFFDVAYEDLCAESPKTLEGVEQFLGSHGVHLAHRGALPESFPMPEAGEIDSGLLESLQAYLDRGVEGAGG